MKPITFRPTKDSLKALEAIKQARGCNQSQAINAALIEAEDFPAPTEAELQKGRNAMRAKLDQDAEIATALMKDKLSALRMPEPTKLTRKAPKPGWKA